MTFDWTCLSDDLWVGMPLPLTPKTLRRVSRSSIKVWGWRKWSVDHIPNKKFCTAQGAMWASDDIYNKQETARHNQRIAETRKT